MNYQKASMLTQMIKKFKDVTNDMSDKLTLSENGSYKLTLDALNKKSYVVSLKVNIMKMTRSYYSELICMAIMLITVITIIIQ